MNMTEFQRQSVDELANLVQANKVEVCGFTFNGTRRWFRLENPHKQHDVKAYIQALSQSVVDICAILFDHGLTTLILPVISPHVMKRRDDNYQQMAIQALKKMSAQQATRRP